jgi:MFS family permease
VQRADPEGKVAALATVSSIAFTVTLFAQPLIGALSDRTRFRPRGRLPWLLGGAFVGGAALAALGFSTSVAVLCAVWALAQFALNGVDVVLSSAVVDEFPRGGRGRPSGVLAASVALGTGLGAVISGVLAPDLGAISVVLAAIVVAGSCAFALLSRRTAAPTSTGPQRSGLVERLRLHRHPDFLWALATRFAFVLGQQGVSVYLLYVLTDHIGVSEASAPAVVSALTATGLVGVLISAVVAGRISDRLGRRRALLVLSSVIFGVGMLVPLAAPVLPAMFVFAAIQGLGLGIHFAVAAALLSEVLPGGDGHAGRDLGLANVVVNAAQAVAPVVAGALVLATGGYAALFVFAIAAAALSAVAAWRVRSVP